MLRLGTSQRNALYGSIKDGAFENFEGAIQEIDNERGKLKLMVSIFGRSTPVELEFWQVERTV